jgi:hypothetical protein
VAAISGPVTRDCFMCEKKIVGLLCGATRYYVCPAILTVDPQTRKFRPWQKVRISPVVGPACGMPCGLQRDHMSWCGVVVCGGERIGSNIVVIHGFFKTDDSDIFSFSHPLSSNKPPLASCLQIIPSSNRIGSSSYAPSTSAFICFSQPSEIPRFPDLSTIRACVCTSNHAVFARPSTRSNASFSRPLQHLLALHWNFPPSAHTRLAISQVGRNKSLVPLRRSSYPQAPSSKSLSVL